MCDDGYHLFCCFVLEKSEKTTSFQSICMCIMRRKTQPSSRYPNHPKYIQQETKEINPTPWIYKPRESVTHANVSIHLSSIFLP